LQDNSAYIRRPNHRAVRPLYNNENPNPFVHFLCGAFPHQLHNGNLLPTRGKILLIPHRIAKISQKST
jgi:hypothetical protein